MDLAARLPPLFYIPTFWRALHVSFWTRFGEFFEGVPNLGHLQQLLPRCTVSLYAELAVQNVPHDSNLREYCVK